MSETVETPPDRAPSEFARRLREVVRLYGSTSAFARGIDRSEGAIRKWLRGESEPNVTDLRSICTLTRTSVDWLVTGRGRREDVATEVREPAALYRATPSVSLDYVLLERIMDAVAEEIRNTGIEITSTKRSTVVVDLYDRFRENKLIDAEAVTRLVKLAA